MPAPGLAVRIDGRQVSQFQKTLRAWATDQLPFATAAALTDTARAARAHVQDGLSEHFKLRNQGLRNAIAYLPANKRDRPIAAYVGVRPWASFLVLQALGGRKVPRKGHRIAVPTEAVRRTSSGRVRKADQPSKLRDQEELIVPMLGKTIALRRRSGVVTYYVLVRSARIEPRWPFEREVRETVEARLGEFFGRRLDEALRTARG